MFRITSSKQLGIPLIAIALGCFFAIGSTAIAQQEGGPGGGGGGTPWPPTGVPPSVDLNSNGIASLLNGGLTGIPNDTPFTNIQFSGVVPSDEQCSIGIDLSGQFGGILLRDPICIRLLQPDLLLPPPFFYFGPTNDCGFGLLPNLPGLSERDPFGLRLLGDFDGQTTTQGCRLLFGPTDDCRIEIDPLLLDGLRLYDPTAIRFCNPFDPTLPPPPLWFGPRDDCGIGVDPNFPGLFVRDDNGLVISNIGSSGKDGVRLNQNAGDRDGLVVSNIGSSGKDGVSIDLGETGECRIQALDGMRLYDPTAIRICNPFDPLAPPPPFWFGEQNNCGFLIDPDRPGLNEVDPVGLRLVGDGSQGCRLIFGPDPNNPCRLEIDPQSSPGDGDGMLVYDPSAIRFCNPFPGGASPPLWFGPRNDCGLSARPDVGLSLYDPTAIRICSSNPNFPPPPLWFGPDDTCGIVVGGGPNGGMVFHDQNPFQFLNDVFAPNFIPTSSKRWKTNIATIVDPIEKIQALRGVSFDWDQDHGGSSSIGLIAEEVAVVIPELVAFEKDGQAARGVNYDSMVGLLIEGMKQQQDQIESQNQAVAKLEAENAKLAKQMAEAKLQSERTNNLEDEVQQLRDQLDAIVASLASQTQQ